METETVASIAGMSSEDTALEEAQWETTRVEQLAQLDEIEKRVAATRAHRDAYSGHHPNESLEGGDGEEENNEPGHAEVEPGVAADDAEAPPISDDPEAPSLLHGSKRHERALDLRGNDEQGNGANESSAAPADREAYSYLGRPSSFHVHVIRTVSAMTDSEKRNGARIFNTLFKKLPFRARLQSFAHCLCATLSTERRPGDDADWRAHRRFWITTTITVVGIIVASIIATTVPILCNQPGRCGNPEDSTPAPEPAPKWEQLGGTLIGNDRDYGSDVAISEQGDVLAVGSPFLWSASEYGYVDIYRYDENTDWNRTARICAPDGTVPHDPNKTSDFHLFEEMNYSIDLRGCIFGVEVSLSDDGKTIMIASSTCRRESVDDPYEDIGYVEVNRLNESADQTWNRYFWLYYDEILPLASADMSSNGRHLAVCHRKGREAWSYDMDRFFENPGNYFGDNVWPTSELLNDTVDVAISGDSETLVVAGSTHAYIYKFGAATWNIEMQQVPDDESPYRPATIEQVAVSKSGKRVAVFDSGLAGMYPIVVTVWEEVAHMRWRQLGDAIVVPARFKIWSMSLSGDGNTVAIAWGPDEESDQFLATFRQNDDGNWEEVFERKDLPFRFWISSCAISYSGKTIACGGDISSNDSGRVVAYRLEYASAYSHQFQTYMCWLISAVAMLVVY